MRLAVRAFGLLLALVLSACSKQAAQPTEAPPPAAAPPTIHSAVAEMARTISAGAGTVGDVKSDGTTGPVLVLEENHAASLGQLNQALLLTRAYEKYGLRTVVLEGYSQGDVDAAAGKLRQKLSGPAGNAVEDVGAALVSEGEITAVEFVALVHPDIHVAKGALSQTAPMSNDAMGRAYSSLKLALALVALEHDVMTTNSESTRQEIRQLLCRPG